MSSLKREAVRCGAVVRATEGRSGVEMRLGNAWPSMLARHTSSHVRTHRDGEWGGWRHAFDVRLLVKALRTAVIVHMFCITCTHRSSGMSSCRALRATVSPY